MSALELGDSRGTQHCLSDSKTNQAYIAKIDAQDTGKVLKAEALSPAIIRPENSGRSHSGTSVIIVQNSEDGSFGELEPSLLRCVKQILASTEGQHSVMLVSGGKTGEGSTEQMTYIIDLDPLAKGDGAFASDNVRLTESTCVEGDGSTICEVSNPSLSQYCTSVSNEPSTPCSPVSEQVEISFVSSPTMIDLNNPSSEDNVGVEIVCSSSVSLDLCQTESKEEAELESHFENAVSYLPMNKSAQSVSCDGNPPACHRPNMPASVKLRAANSVSLAEDLPGFILSMAKSILDSTSLTRQFSKEELPNNVSYGTAAISNSNYKSIQTAVASLDQVKADVPEVSVNNAPATPIVTETLVKVSGEEKEVEHFSETQEPKVVETLLDESTEKCNDLYAPPPEVGEILYRCTECGYCSHNKHYYKQHVDLVHSQDRPYKCPHCDYAGKRRHALLEHLVVHSNLRPFTCDHCNASFRKKGHLTNHIKLHTSQKLVHCGVCNIQLPDAEAFESHLHKIHNTDKLYKCRLCDYTVVDREVMLKHLHEHNEVVMFSCPKCPSLFSNEENLAHHINGNHHFSFLPASTEKTVEPGNIAHAPSLQMSHPASIICSECGFVSKDTDMMQRHMWTHIKKEAKNKLHVNGQNQLASHPDTNHNSLSVLKTNLDSEQKSLPRDVVYQCSSCSFTSSDSSMFIKHMLAHKTQQNQQLQSSSSQAPNPPVDNNQLAQVLASASNHSINLVSEPATKPTSSVPFIYDKASARFRCVICGYHCEFQRTIKAHIWKHSGHQNIEYPTFDHPSSTRPGSGPADVQTVPSKDPPRKVISAGLVTGSGFNSSTVSDASSSKSLSDMKTLGKAATHQMFGVASQHNYHVTNPVQDKIKLRPTLAEPLGVASSGQVMETQPFFEQVKFRDYIAWHALQKSRGAPNGELEQKSVANGRNADGKGLISNYLRQYQVVSAEQDDTRSSCEVDEKNSEPSVVVEVVDTVPSGFGFTGMKSQQGSPRMPDLDTEARLVGSFVDRRSSVDSDISTVDSEKSDIQKLGFRSVRAPIVNIPEKQLSTKLRCPTCDCLLMEDFKTHLLNCQNQEEHHLVKSADQSVTAWPEKSVDVTSTNILDNEVENPQAEDTDSVESSDEMVSSGSTLNQQKSGICSSLLAVIEQLRERSRSESEEEKQLMPISRKSVRKKVHQENSVELGSIEDWQNIEKILENGGEKFRCSLCHYSSHRVCNIKLHMKTHRQKKPSECSLCDFSSNSPEALQEHMLKHCKVRTYACKFCPQSFNHKSTLRAHLRAHKDQEPFLCAYCVFETSNPMEYREHMQVHSGCSSRLRCPCCDLILSNKEELTAHLLVCKGGARKRCIEDDNHKLEIDLDVEHKQANQTLPVEPAATQHACVVQGCSFASYNLKELQEHLSVHCNPSLLVCNLCDFKALHSRSLKSHMKRHANDQRYVQQPLEQYKCNLCGYVCHHLPSLKSHMWRHASDQSYSYEFTNDVINAAIDHDTRVDADGEADDPELLDRVINSERKILEGELSKFSRGDGQRPICWVTFRCCSCGFETINKAKLNIHMRSHSDIIQKALDIPRKVGTIHNKGMLNTLPSIQVTSKRPNGSNDVPTISIKLSKREELFPI